MASFSRFGASKPSKNPFEVGAFDISLQDQIQKFRETWQAGPVQASWQGLLEFSNLTWHQEIRDTQVPNFQMLPTTSRRLKTQI